jgi:hypothetical protein
MENESTVFKNSGLSRIFFILSVVGLIFCILGQVTDVYRYKVTGAIFEILWLPMLLIIFVLPVISAVFLIKERLNPRSLYLYSFLISAGSVLLVVFSG